MSGIRIVESQLNPADAVYSQEIPAGEPWIHEIRRGQIFRIVDLRGNQAVDTLFYNAHDYADRYSAQDTIREQRNIYLTTGSELISTQRDRPADHHGRHLRPPRYAGRRLRQREQHGALCHRQAPHARLPQQLSQRG